ncbi:MAG: helix-turn-helix transcriptional regulator [Crocinitomicaceae bacterium]|nr:helix-turn-helix transcriptional regulator [Crocinitomicaceae bacterium]
MMEKSIKYWHAMSAPAMLEQLGEFVKQTRLQQNKTQQQVAIAAGINRSTMVQIEKGAGGTLLSFIQVLRALEQLQIFEYFQIKQQFSPLQLAKLEQNKRQRASTKKDTQNKKPKSDW